MSTHLIDIMDRIGAAAGGRQKIVLVGDLMLDRYIFGSTERVSPEAPVPIIHFQREEYRLGGAGFVMANLATLGATVQLIGVIGKDDAGAEIKRRIGDFSGATNALIETDSRPTVLKVRLLGSSQDRTPHQMLRLDIESSRPCDEATAQRIITETEKALQGADLLCLEDYNKGVLSPQVCQRLIELARQKNIPIIIDPANIPDYSKYTGATCLKLNRPEAERCTGLPLRGTDHYQPAADAILKKLDLQAVVITLNEHGSYLATRDGEHRWIQTRPRQVADGTGAGDTLLAMLSVARCAGADWTDAVALGNIAAGLEVEKLGCVPITRDEIVQDILLEARQHLGKLRTLESLVPELSRHRSMGKKIVFTNGCFDLIHLGHIKYFQFAKSQGDLLIVAVNTDCSIRRLKGDKRPIIPETDRLAVLEELESIDYLLPFDDDTPLRLIQSILPDVLVKGADYAKEQVVGWDVVEAHGGTVALAPLVDGRSTSGLIQRILEAYK
jgi:D-beta-D-heptose 7-phosphate kinase / D-beta-D-heptose 1-phosphate adenosyltransferase